MPWWRRNVSTTCSASPCRMSPVSTKTQVSWSTDGLVHERGRDGGVDSARQPADHPLAAHLRADRVDRRLDDRVIVHVGRHPHDVVQEVLEHLLAVRRVHDLGVELHAVEPRRVGCSNAATGASAVRRGDREARRGPA